MKKSELIDILQKYDTSIDRWGKGGYKSIDNLLKEINLGETVLKQENGVLTRRVSFVNVNIYYTDNTDYYILKEDKQVFSDGTSRTRNNKGAVAEKIMGDEDPSIAAVRGVKEELGVDIISDNLYNYRDYKMLSESKSYPTLLSSYVGHYFAYNFNSFQYNPNGYVEVQDHLTTYFKWVKRKVKDDNSK